MFSSKNLFSEVDCPYQDTCILPRCIFSHQDGNSDVGKSIVHSQRQLSEFDRQDGQRKRQKVGDKIHIPATGQSAQSSRKDGYPGSISDMKAKPQASPSQKSPVEAKGISPAPSRRKPPNTSQIPNPSDQINKNSASDSNPISANTVVRPPSKLPLKAESLNPRILKIQAPAGHDMRFRLLRALYDQLKRLNTELEKNASSVEERLVLSEQELITKALDIEEESTSKPAIYSNLVKNKIMFYKRMSVKQWMEERRKEAADMSASDAVSVSDNPTIKLNEAPISIETGLNLREELTLLHRLYTPITGLSNHGYVTSIPTNEEIESSKRGVEAAKGWEVCDRCKNRFQVFPERREEDGALASGGKCTYHFGKPYWEERSALNPKAKREKKFRCCGETLGQSTGCVQADTHVFKISEVKRLASILNFEETPENPERVSDKPVCIDGEMGYTVYGLELIRLTATSWPESEELFDVLVRPLGPILDLNSRYSGVWPKDMAEARPWTASLPEESDSSKRKLRILDSPIAARALLFSYLSPTTPLIGHGLENDLNAIRIIHPTIIDTALLFPHKAGLPYRNGLKMLMHTHLNRHIQVVVDGKMEGHDSKEDANAAGDLVRFALTNEWKKMEKDGWILDNGELRPPKEPMLEVSTGLRMEKALSKVSPSVGIGRKRPRQEMDER